MTGNPGLNLFEWLQKHFPMQKSEPSTWIKKVTEEMCYEGLDEFLWQTTLKMVLRRLIATRELYRRERRGGDPETAFLKDFINSTFSISRTERAALSNLVEQAHRAYRQDIPDRLTRQAHNRVKQNGACCELCGVALQVEREDEFDYRTLDHIWPRALGGPPTEENLRLVCKRCNSLRQDISGLCDTDFQLFHVRVPMEEDDSYSKEFSRKYRMAVADDFNQSCAICNLPVTAPKLLTNFKQIRRDEAPGTFNVQLVCDRHGHRGFEP